jgi:outer membrane protein insertion porin family
MVVQVLISGSFALPAKADDEPMFKVPGLTGHSSSEASASTAKATAAGGAELDGRNLTVEDVTVEGNRIIPADRILEVVKTKRGDKFDKNQVVQDLKAVNGMGYFDDRSLQAVPELSSSGVLLKIRVQENAPVTGFAFQGNTQLSNEDLAKLFIDQLGKPQNLSQLSQAIDKVEQAYHEKGFTLARVTDVKDDPDGSVHLQIDEGVINSVQIVGNKKTKDFIIRNNIKAKPGAVYNEKTLTADLRKLYSNGYFQDIRRSLSPSTSDPDKYDLKVEVDEKRSTAVGLGGGLDAQYGPFGSASFSEGNFRGTGDQLSANAQAGTGIMNQFGSAVSGGAQNLVPSARQYQLSANYSHDLGHDTCLNVSPFARDLASMAIDNAMQRSVGLNVSINKKLSEHVSAGIGFLGEDVLLNSVQNLESDSSVLNRAMQLGYANAGNAGNYVENVRKQALKGGAYVGINPSIAYDTRDQGFDPHQGLLARASAGPNLALNGSSFMKIGASASKYIPAGKDKTIALNVQGGAGVGGVPQFAAYRLGGFNGIRGYSMFGQLGTGTNMLMSSAEYRMPLPFLPKGDPGSPYGKAFDYAHKNLRFVLFADAGAVNGNNVYNSLYSRINMGAAVGVGVRFKCPMIGMVRVDYGLPLIAPIAGGKFIPRLTFGFGDNK